MPAELPAIDPTGKSETINVQYSMPKIVILLFDPNCVACDDNWPYWEKLRREENTWRGIFAGFDFPNRK